MVSLISLGPWVAIYPTGLVLLQRTSSRAPRGIGIGVAVATGFAAWSLLMLAMLWCDAFSPKSLGAAGWLVAAIWLAYTLAACERAAQELWYAALIAVVIAGAAALYGLYPVETPLGNRDEGIYSARAEQFVRTGRDHIAPPLADALTAAPHRPYINGQQYVFPGIYAGERVWTYQFSAIPSLWMAQSLASLGELGRYRANAAIAAFGLLVFLGLARGVLNLEWSLVATAVFATNPAQVWIARINLSEPLAQVLTLGGIAVALLALEQRQPRIAAVAAILFGMAVAVRIDLVVIAPALSFAWLVHAASATERDADHRATWCVLTIGTAITAAAAVAAYLRMSPRYLDDNAAYVFPALASVLIPATGVGLLSIGARHAAKVRALVSTLNIPFAAVLITAFAYAAFLRPYTTPFALIQRPGSPLDGLRDYRESSLVNLAAYVTWPALVLALAGVILTIRSALRGERAGSAALLASVLGGPLVLFLFKPGVAPDHFWAIRRFVPTGIPAVILFAAIAISAAAARLRWHPAPRAACALAGSAAAVMLFMQRDTVTVAENRGLTEAIRAGTGASSGSLYLLRNGSPLGAPLLAAGERVLPLRDSMAYDPDIDAAVIRKECHPQQPCRVIYDDLTDMAGLSMARTSVMTVRRKFIERTYNPLPRKTVVEERTWFVGDLEGLQPGTAAPPFGARRDWRTAEAGLYATELGPGWSFRWTNGAARLSVPADRTAESIEFHLLIPDRPDFRMRLAMNDKVLFDGPAPAGPWVNAFPVPADSAGQWRVVLDSSSFVPAELGASDDKRRLGVALMGIRLLHSGQAALTDGLHSFALRSRIERLKDKVPVAIVQGATEPVPVAVSNPTDKSWTDQVAGARVRLGILWFRAGQTSTLAETRVDFPFGVAAGETVVMNVPLTPQSSDGHPFEPGRYRVLVSPVLEGFAWFYLRGDTPLELDVEVAPKATERAS